MLDSILNGKKSPKIIKLPPIGVVARASTDISMVSDAEVAAALSFIKANIARQIRVEDVLDSVAIARRSLERRFRKSIGRSVATEIRRSHVEKAKALLIQTDFSVGEIAELSGFAGPTPLGVVFRKEVGLSPTDFRRRNTTPRR